MDAEQTRLFADELMRLVWEPLDSAHVPSFYRRDMVGHHVGYRGCERLGYDDVVRRLDWDRNGFTDAVYEIEDLVAVEDRFAIRFHYTATTKATGEKVESTAEYFYHLANGKIAEFWLLADVDFDYTRNFSNES